MDITKINQKSKYFNDINNFKTQVDILIKKEVELTKRDCEILNAVAKELDKMDGMILGETPEDIWTYIKRKNHNATDKISSSAFGTNNGDLKLESIIGFSKADLRMFFDITLIKNFIETQINKAVKQSYLKMKYTFSTLNVDEILTPEFARFWQKVISCLRNKGNWQYIQPLIEWKATDYTEHSFQSLINKAYNTYIPFINEIKIKQERVDQLKLITEIAKKMPKETENTFASTIVYNADTKNNISGSD